MQDVGTTNNAGTINAVAGAGATAVVFLAGAVNNIAGILLASAATSGTAGIDLGENGAVVSGGTLKTIGSGAKIGVLEAMVRHDQRRDRCGEYDYRGQWVDSELYLNDMTRFSGACLSSPRRWNHHDQWRAL